MLEFLSSICWYTFYAILLLIVVLVVGIITLALLWQKICKPKVAGIKDDNGKPISQEEPKFPFGNMMAMGRTLDEALKYFKDKPEFHLLWMFHNPFISIANAEASRYVLSTNSSNYTRTTFIPKGSLVAEEGKDFTRHRRIVQKALQKNYFKNIVPTIVSTLSENQTLFTVVGDNKRIDDVFEWSYQTIAKLIAFITYGKNEQTQIILQANKVMQSRSLFSLAFRMIPILKYLPISAARKWNKAVADYKVIDTMISNLSKQSNESEMNSSSSSCCSDDEATLLSLLVKSSANDKEGLTDAEIKSNAIGFAIGGNDSTSSAMTSVFYNLSIHQQYQQQIQTEIDQYFPLGKEINLGEIGKLKELGKFIKESLRLFPPFPSSFFRSPSSPDSISSYKVDNKNSVVISILRLHRNEAYWPNADTFNPDRFSKDATANYGTPITPFSYIPFGGGPRSCIAERLATLILKINFILILQKYTITPHNNDDSSNGHISFSIGAILSPTKPLAINLIKRT